MTDPRSTRLIDDTDFLSDLRGDLSQAAVAMKWGISTSTAHKWRNRLRKEDAAETKESAEKPIRDDFDQDKEGNLKYQVVADRILPLSFWLERLRKDGFDPKLFLYSVGHSVWTQHTRDQVTKTLYANRFGASLKPAGKGKDATPAWPVVQRAEPVRINHTGPVPQRSIDAGGYRVGLKCGDTQIGFRRYPDGTLDPFHDEQAMALFIQVCFLYQPDVIHILGDFIDMAEQGRFAQEASFANTTQLSLNAGHRFLAELRTACPNSRIIVIEGNHDLRLQNFIETNAKAAFGLKRADMPDEWPVMSLPYLLRLEELDVEYVDAYPAATDWDNPKVRNIHGTKANSKGSTMAQYVHELPHVSTWAGHTHRAEVVYRTVLGDYGNPIESYAANPGVLCRTDGGVPSVRGAIGASGIPARIVEDWQQGFGVHIFNETESWPSVYRIKNGRTIIDGRIIDVA